MSPSFPLSTRPIQSEVWEEESRQQYFLNAHHVILICNEDWKPIFCLVPTLYHLLCQGVSGTPQLVTKGQKVNFGYYTRTKQEEMINRRIHTYLFLSPNVAVILSHGTQQQFAILLQGSLPDHKILESLYVSSILWVFVCVLWFFELFCAHEISQGIIYHYS